LDELKTHPLNARIYGDEADQPLVDSIMEHGVMQPVLIDQRNRIISGHRRSNAAKKAGLTEIPVTIFLSEDELDIEAALIESNRQRIKTNEQEAREASCLLEVAKQRARIRKTTANSNTDLPAISPGDTGDARDVVGKKLGIGGKKVDQSSAVISAIDKLSESGKKDEAQKLRDVLNNGSLNRAHDLAKETGALKDSAAEKLNRLWKKVPAEKHSEVMALAKKLAGEAKMQPEHHLDAITQICPADESRAASNNSAKKNERTIPTWNDAISTSQVRQWAVQALNNLKKNTNLSETVELLELIVSALTVVDNNNNAAQAALTREAL